jgi:3-methyladenine DNA glycosylase AlkD
MKALPAVRREIRALADPKKAEFLRRFFKSGPGQYGEGDVLLGIIVPKSRIVARRHFQSLTFAEIGELLGSRYHEERLIALLMLVLRFQKGDEKEREKVFRLYCRSTRWINNWDLVDTSAPYIVGPHLEKRDRSLLHRWSRSKSLWERRIAILSTFYFIRHGDFRDCLAISERLLSDDHDLIHKAVGWMLREVGRRDRKAETAFLDRFAKKMPRTMLRYALEHFPPPLRRVYMAR